MSPAHRLSTGGIEEVVAAHPDVAECAVMGVADPLKGQVPLGLVVLKAGAARPEEAVADEVVALVRERIGPVASFKTALVVDRLPKTRSGKILRGTMRRIADGEDYRMPATIDDPAILGEIEEALARAGYPEQGADPLTHCRRGSHGSAAACGATIPRPRLARERSALSRVRERNRRRFRRVSSRPARSPRSRRARRRVSSSTGAGACRAARAPRRRRVPAACTGRARPGGAA